MILSAFENKIIALILRLVSDGMSRVVVFYLYIVVELL